MTQPRSSAARVVAGCMLAVLTIGCAAALPEDVDMSPPGDHPETAAPEGEGLPTPEPTPALTSPPATQSPTPTACTDPRGCYGQPRLVGEFDAELIPEASGLAAARRNPDVLYLLDDRPGTSEVWAVRTDGTLLGQIAVAGLDALDTESLAVAPCSAEDPTPCVYVGDIGDNLRSRTHITVHRFPEPDLADGVPEGPVEATVARWTYPDGAHDAEALIVDDAAQAFIVTKAPFDREARTTGDARLYRAPDFADGVLEDLGALPVPEPAAPLQSLLVGNVVTGGDYRAGRVLLRTYDQVLEYIAEHGDTDLASLATWQVRSVPSPPELQSEAITWAAGGCGYYTAGEMVGDLWYVPCVP